MTTFLEIYNCEHTTGKDLKVCFVYLAPGYHLWDHPVHFLTVFHGLQLQPVLCEGTTLLFSQYHDKGN